MTDFSIVDPSLQLGTRTVDPATGELLCNGYTNLAGRTPGGHRVSGGDPGGAPAEVGLSNSHICTSQPKGNVDIWVGGGLISCSKPKLQSKQLGGGRRGKVTGFSSSSRRRMLYLIGKIERVKLPVMITLTYPSEWPSSGVVWKNHLRRWWQRLKRRVPAAGGIWKLEPQKRGAPHFHLLVWGLEDVPWVDLLVWVSRSWYEVVGSGDKKHLVAGTRVERIRNRKGVMSYATKYLGKINEAGMEGWDEPGRFWGVKSAQNIPWAGLFSCALTFGQSVRLLRLMRRYMKCHRGNLPSLTMLSNNPDHWFERLEDLIT